MKKMENNDIVITRMTVEDVEIVSSIEKECFSTPWTKEGFLESLNNEYSFFLVAKTKDGEIAGYCGCYQSFDEGEIPNVAVAASHRRKGIAEKMLFQLMEVGRQRGIKNYTLEVRVHNVSAIRLYEKIGFENVGIRKNFYRNPVEDAMIMWYYG